MEFSNHTPFPALAFESVLPDGAAFHTVVLRQTFELRDGSLVLAETQKPLATADRFYGEPNRSSIAEESDLAPYKPHCDVLINASAYAPSGRAVPRFAVRAQIVASPVESAQTSSSTPKVLLDRSLEISGPREFIRRSGLSRCASQLIAMCSLGLVRRPAWKLTSPEPIAELPLRYEYAWGGECRVTGSDPAAKRIPKDIVLNGRQETTPAAQGDAPVAHSVCEDNPVGTGFVEPWFMKAVKPERIRTPQIESASARITAQAWIDMQKGQSSAPLRPAGFGVVGKAWLPRRARAGTYDEQWLAERHPGLPEDFEFSYWNGASAEMQTPHLKGNESILLTNLVPVSAPGVRADTHGNTLLRFQLPGHLPMGWAYTDRALKFAPLLLDTLSIDLSDAGKPTVTLVWRATFLKAAGIRRFEARFVGRTDVARLAVSPENSIGVVAGALMADPLEVTVSGDAADVFRQQFNIQSVEQARNAASNLGSLWNTPNPWSERGRPEDRETFDWAGQEVQKRFESGRYKPQADTQPGDHFSTANKIAARQNGSFKAVSNTPDVCKTPMGSSTPPVPYQVTADLGGSTGIVPSVRFNGKPAYVLDQSVVPSCSGDEPGSANGVKSGTVGGEVKPTKGSSTVRASGHAIIRDGDPCTMNNGNCTGTYVTAPAPGSSVDASGNVVGDANPPPDKGALHQVGGFFKGAGGALWDMGKGIVGLGVGAAKLSPVSQAAEGLSNLTGLYNYHGYSETQQAVSQTAQAIYDHPGAIVDGITKPYAEAWAQGNYGEALGRGAIDVGGLFVGGVGAVGKAGEAANVAGKVGEAANATGKAGEIAAAAGEAADAAEQAGKVARAGARTGEGADAAEHSAEIAKAADAQPAGDGIKVKPADDPRYKRGKFRKGVREKVWNEAKKTSEDGKVRDPVTGEEMNADDPWDMGHKPGLEHRKHIVSAAERNITREDFLNEYNDPSHYRPELPSSNRSHVGEDLTDDYFGP